MDICGSAAADCASWDGGVAGYNSEMPTNTYEGTLNTWLAQELRSHGLDARAESGQGGGKRLDVEISFDSVRIGLEAERGQSTAKKASAIKDADSRLHDDLVDCAVAICYPDELFSPFDLSRCQVLHTLRTHKNRPPANKTQWKQDDIAQLVSVIRRIPDQLGDPDNIANLLSFSLDRAVSRLNESQKFDLAQCLDLPSGKPIKIEFGSAQTSRYNQAAKRAMLVIVTAIMFHSQLDKHRHEITPLWDHRYNPPRSYAGSWPPPTASRCAESTDPVGAFSKAWNLWLVVDYKPIFATARSALLSLAQDSALSAAVQGVARAALRVTRNIVGLRHDLLGRIFHRVLESARYDGSFYTTTAAATLLANLAIREDMCNWSDSNAIAHLRITDPACGTGTLLMAAAERIRDLSIAAQHDRVSRALIENVLTGYDVNLTATHLAATTLGLLSPTTAFREMKIGRALLGIRNGKAYLGSLEFLDENRPALMMPWPTGVEQMETEQEVTLTEPVDLIIMNPPFTRDSLRHDQFKKQEEDLLKEREKMLFDGQPVHLSSNGNSFLILAEHMASEQNGVIASVLPLVTATNASSLGIRKFLAEQFHVEVVITSHDLSRAYFSENTSIGEMLLICRRWPSGVDKPATKVVNLYENPATPAAAISVAQNIINDKREDIKGTVQAWPAERVISGNWGAVQFLSPHLCEKFIDLTKGTLLKTQSLGRFAEIGPAGQGVRGIFDRSEVPDENAMIALWDHKTDSIQKMSARRDTYIVAKKGKETQAYNYWTKRGTLLLAARARLNTVRAVCVRMPQRVLGSAWVPCKPIKNYEAFDIEAVEKAICAYLNSTVGFLAILGNRSIKHLSYSQFSMDDLRNIPVPDFVAMDKQQVLRMSSAYDDLCDSPFLPLPQMEECDTRMALDDAIISALDIDAEVVATIRRELSREPSVTGKPYEREWDYTENNSPQLSLWS